ncbi:hypothetical protein BDR05DRAFT_954153, partial [Suillus weaverae]
ARSGRIWKGGIFNIDWSILTRDEVGKLHQKIIETLHDRQFGPYRVGQILFGSAQAQTLGMKTYTYTVNPGVASTSLGKRVASSITAAGGTDDEIEIVEMGAPAARRRRLTSKSAQESKSELECGNMGSVVSAWGVMGEPMEKGGFKKAGGARE